MHIESANKIIEYIHVNGGSIASAARALDLVLTPRTRAAVLELDPEIERFRYAFKRHNNWFTLPSKKAETRDAQKVDAVCLFCNTVHSLSQLNKY